MERGGRVSSPFPVGYGMKESYSFRRPSGEPRSCLPRPSGPSACPTSSRHYIDSLVASGTYATGSEVVRAGSESLAGARRGRRNWLRDEVVTCSTRWGDEPGQWTLRGRRARPASAPAMLRGYGTPIGEPDGRLLAGGRNRFAGHLDYVAERAGTARALGYVERILAHARVCDFPERGRRGRIFRPGLRVTGVRAPRHDRVSSDCDRVVSIGSFTLAGISRRFDADDA